jgi:hypothetical protein
MRRKLRERAVAADPSGRDDQRGMIEQGMAGLNVRVHRDRAVAAQGTRRRPNPQGLVLAGTAIAMLAVLGALLLVLA